MPNEQTPNPGCRPSQLLGVWSMEPNAFESLYAQALSILESDSRYEIVSRESRQLAQEEKDNPYQVDTNGVAHVTVEGPITRRPTSMQSLTGGTSSILFERAMDLAGSDPNVRGALLHVDSPGGHSVCQAEMRSAIQRFKATGKPVSGHAAGSGCSAAYGLLAECDTISADPAAVVGSVGTMLALKDTSELMKRAGVKPLYIATGDRKAATAPGQAISDDTIADLNKFVSDAGEAFRDRVKERRPQISEAGMKDVLRGGVYAGKAAKDIGLVDHVCDTREAIDAFTQRISSGSSSGSALSPASGVGAPQTRSRTMLTTEQLTQAKSLPGCGDITAENADAKLLAAATSLQATASRVPTLETEIGTLKAQVPQQIPAQYLQQSASGARAHYETALASKAFSPAIGGQLCSLLIGEDTALNATTLVVGATGDCLASAVFKTLAANGPMPRVGEQTTSQPAPKAVAGAPEGDDLVAAAAAEAKSFEDRQLSARGLK